MDDIMNEGSGPRSALGSLLRVGESVSGYIIGDPQKKPDIDETTGEQKTFSKTGDLRWIWVVPIQTELQEDELDDGRRSLWLSWKSLTAFTEAVREGWRLSGRDGKPRPEIGGHITMTVAKVTATGFAGSKTKDWKGTYVAPSAPPQAMDMMTDGSQPTSPAPQTPPPPPQVPPTSRLAGVAQQQGTVLSRMQETAAARRAGTTVPVAHHSDGEPPF